MKPGAFAAVVGGALLAACAFSSHEVTITAKAPTTQSSVGEGVTVALKLIDDRDDLTIGQRGAGMNGADITAGSMVPDLKREIRKGLEAKGFTVVSSRKPADAELDVKLRAVKFFIETGFMSGAENTSVVVNVEAEKANDDYERTYRYHNESGIVFVPSSSAIDERINGGLSRVLNEMMTDTELINFLAN